MSAFPLSGVIRDGDNYDNIGPNAVAEPQGRTVYSTSKDAIPSATQLPFEIWFLAFEYLDIVDLMNCSEVCTQFRIIVFSKQLKHSRFENTSLWLENQFPNRPTFRDLYERHILMSSSPFANGAHIRLAMKLQRALRRESLKRKLETRPTHKELVQHGVIRPGGALACRMRSLERQQIVDAIQAFFRSSQRPTVEKAIQRGLVSPTSLKDEGHKPVRFLTRMFSLGSSTKSLNLNSKDGTGLHRSDPPTRVKVHKLRHKFEQLEKKLQDPCYEDVYESQEKALEKVGVSPLKKQLTGISSGAVASLRQRFVSISG